MLPAEESKLIQDVGAELEASSDRAEQNLQLTTKKSLTPKFQVGYQIGP
jgi:hypothetical protein